MRSLLLLTLLAVAVPDREDPTPKSKAKPIQQQILGEWQLVGTVIGGNPDRRKDDRGAVLTFTASEIQIAENGKRQENDDAVYTLDATRKPVAIDITPKRGGERKIEGILKVEGDQLVLCFPHGGGAMRPTDFVSAPQSQVAVMHFKRIKK